MLARSKIQHNWEELGFPNKKTAEAAHALSNKATSPQKPKILLTDLQSNKRQQIATEEEEAITDGKLHFLCNLQITSYEGRAENATESTVRVLNAGTKIAQLPLTLSKELPSINLPIGYQEGPPSRTLEALLDSCAGVNIGELEYYQSVAEHHPELVAAIKPIKAYTCNHISIGGANHEGKALAISHIISYCTPFTVQGIPVLITMGLSNGAAASTILYISFCKK
eukprot:CAMPEP_0178937018 /NCGR_PEP_ID=MMETSP0786-20121207/25508_1 /TAXON_ID=186022 /ORGANISM="Thalassionema frauenfeldii, Strain CCMP 1798" /LENGTH=224 /DNA_ID=CAMNT_0020615511 /DNA_START=415 /DNA_END=1089 /DNA_ORIENTATION=-